MSTSGAELITAWASAAAAIGTVGAFAIGGAVVFREQRRERESAERAQAARVAAWHQVISGSDPRLSRAYPDVRMIALLVRNDSDLPVYRATLFWELDSGEYDVKDMNVLGPHSERATGLRAERRANDWITGAGITFFDAAGAEWTRALNGELRRGQHAPAHLRKRIRVSDSS